MIIEWQKIRQNKIVHVVKTGPRGAQVEEMIHKGNETRLLAILIRWTNWTVLNERQIQSKAI